MLSVHSCNERGGSDPVENNLHTRVQLRGLSGVDVVWRWDIAAGQRVRCVHGRSGIALGYCCVSSGHGCNEGGGRSPVMEGSHAWTELGELSWVDVPWRLDVIV